MNNKTNIFFLLKMIYDINIVIILKNIFIVYYKMYKYLIIII